MSDDKTTDWDDEQQAPAFNLLESGAVRVALLFGSIAVAFALILGPIVDRGAGNLVAQRSMSEELDRTATGSISRTNEYTVRHSVLQSSPASVCIIKKDGQESGEC